MNFLIISKYAMPKHVGFETRHYSLGKVFKKRGYNVHIIRSNSNHLSLEKKPLKSYTYIDDDGIKNTVIKGMTYRKPGSLRRILSWIEFELRLFFYLKKYHFENESKVIVSSLSIFTVINGLLAKKRNKKEIKLIFEIRDIWPKTLVLQKKINRLHPFVILLSFVEKLGLNKFDLIIGTMPNLVKHIEEITPKNISKTKCIPNGYNSEDLDIINQINIRTHSQTKFTVGYSGSIGFANALEIFIATILLFNDIKPSIHFKIIGDGEFLPHYKMQLKECENVEFTGKLNKVDMYEELSKCDILYVSTRDNPIWNYGWSLNKLSNYLLIGKPVIAAYSGYRSIINESNCGVFIEPENPEALKDSILSYHEMTNEERNEIGLRGRTWLIQNRSWNIIAQEYINLIHEL